MKNLKQIDPVISFRNSQGEAARGTIISIRRTALIMEIYNPHSIVQISEVLREVTIRRGTANVYAGRSVVSSMLSTGLTVIVSLTLVDEWQELNNTFESATAIGDKARHFVSEWNERSQIAPAYAYAINQCREFLSEVSRWVDQVDISDALPKEHDRLRIDVFEELATPIMGQLKSYFDIIEEEARLVDDEVAPFHRAFAQNALHPLLLRSPFVYRTYTKPLGYAGDYQMVNQILDDPRQGPSTYFQIINSAFLHTAVVVAHRNRIDLLVDFLTRMADAACAEGRPYRVLNIGCGPAIEVQRFLQTYPRPEMLAFELVDFSDETLAWTRNELEKINATLSERVDIAYIHNSVHDILKRKFQVNDGSLQTMDAVYCAGLFDYLSDKVCHRLIKHFASRTKNSGRLFVTNVHASNPEKYSMEHILEWYLIYRDEAGMRSVIPEEFRVTQIYTDSSGVNVFAEATREPREAHR